MTEGRLAIGWLPRAVVLALFVMTAFGGSSSGQGDRSSDECELTPPASIAALVDCRASHPRDVEILMDLAAAYERADQWGDATTQYEQALAIDAGDGEAHRRLGTALLRDGNFAGALSEGREALRLQPGSRRALELVAQSSDEGRR